MKRFKPLFLLFGLFFLISGISRASDEIFEIKKRFQEIIVPEIKIEDKYRNQILKDALERFLEAGITESQYFVYVDRNPAKQLIFVLFFDGKDIVEIGRDLISTGNPKKGKNYFLTPTGIFKNSVDNFNYRALGTKNDLGWRGLGKKGSRVWDLGWQESHQVIRNQKIDFCCIRLLMHATDPDYGEQRLGKPDSQGCIRISAKMNELLDLFGLLDKEYEDNAEKIKNISWLLRKDRKDIKHKGQYVVVGDSGDFTD